jgi:hypothetical protein
VQTGAGRIPQDTELAIGRMHLDLDPKGLGDRIEYGLADCGAALLSTLAAIATGGDAAELTKAAHDVYNDCMKKNEEVRDDLFVGERMTREALGDIWDATGSKVNDQVVKACKTIYVTVKEWVSSKKDWADSDYEEEGEGYWIEREEEQEDCS